ncbi:hypothetical protein D9M69_592010 [compost metagenome]
MMKARCESDTIKLLSPIITSPAPAEPCARTMRSAWSSAPGSGLTSAVRGRRSSWLKASISVMSATATMARSERGAKPSNSNCHHTWFTYSTSR